MGSTWSSSAGNLTESVCVGSADRPIIPTKQETKIHLGMMPENVRVIQDKQKDTGQVRKDWSSQQTVEMMKRALSQLLESLSKETEEFAEFDLKRIQQFAVDVTLDPDTAHPELILSHDAKQVRHQGTRQSLPDIPERFDHCFCVLGKEGFSSGRLYYEVQVRGKTKWDLGVTQESVSRKGKIVTSPKNGYWTVWLRNKNKYEACDSPPVPLSLKQAPQKVGVFVEYEEGLVSFYDVDAKCLMYSYTGQIFTEKLYPFFSTRSSGDKNTTPLIVTPVQQST